ncbi:MAG: acid phosphatase [Chlorobium sp.]|nr:MAG: acid phosphatase [Chlorobium sp.]
MGHISFRRFKPQLFLIVILCLLSGYNDSFATSKETNVSLDKIETIVVIYAENRSFDNLYGLFPGANGVIKNADGKTAKTKDFIQVDRDGVTLLKKLPAVWNASGTPVADKLSFISELPNAPFRIDAQPGSLHGGLTADKATPDLAHRFYNNQMQINNGKNNMFAALSDAGGLTMGYYDGSVMQMWKLAEQYTLADNFFMGAFGGSFLNHFWLISASTPTFPYAPKTLTSSVDKNGVRLNLAENSPAHAEAGKPVYVADQSLTPDGYAVNTMQPPYQPSVIPPAPDGNTLLADKTKNPLPPQEYKTIGDALSSKGVQWVWYAGAWNEALTNRNVINNSNTSNFQTHHQPFNYFKRFDPTTAEGSLERKNHLKDYSDLQKDIDAGTLPSVVFYKPQGSLNQHPGYADVMTGDKHLAEVIARLQKSPQWKKMAIIVTYDENGGYWDHASPPKGDRWGPGTRIPAIIISPFSKNHFVDHTYYDTTSILKFITKRFQLEPLPGIRLKAGDLSNAFDFSRSE